MYFTCHCKIFDINGNKAEVGETLEWRGEGILRNDDDLCDIYYLYKFPYDSDKSNIMVDTSCLHPSEIEHI